MPERLAELLDIYLEHFNQHPKNGDAYKSFLSKQLCFGHEFVSGPDDVEGIFGSKYWKDARHPSLYLKPLLSAWHCID